MTDSKAILKKILKFVLFMHGILLLSIAINWGPSKKKTVFAKKVLKENFRTIEKPKTKKTIVAKSSTKVTSPPKKTDLPPKDLPKKIVKAPTQVAQKKTSSPPKKVLELPKETFEELVASPSTAPLILPQVIAKLNIEDQADFQLEESEGLGRYGQTLQSIILQQELKIKAGSFVSIELTLNKNGEVVKIKHLNSSDTLTKDRVIETLSKLTFPNFFGEIASQKEYTFPITLNSLSL